MARDLGTKGRTEPLKIIWPEMKSAKAISNPPVVSDGDVNSGGGFILPADGPTAIPLPGHSRFRRSATDK